MRRRQPRVSATAFSVLVTLTLAIGLVQLGSPRPAAAVNICSVSPICATLTVTLGGDGAGTWQSTTNNAPDGLIDCQESGGIAFGTCSHTYEVGPAPASIAISDLLVPAPGSLACASAITGCVSGPTTGQLILSSNAVTQSGFVLVTPFTLTASTSGLGTGTVTSHPMGIVCGTKCSGAFPKYSTVTLTATPAPGSMFVAWVGAGCSGQGSSCVLEMIGVIAPDAEFELRPSPTPSPPPGPAASAPRITLLSLGTAGATTVPALVRWSVLPAAAPIIADDLQVATNGGSWIEVGLTSALSTTAGVNLRLGVSTQFRVRAADAAGYTGPWTVGHVVKALAYQETSSSITYTGAWSTRTILSVWAGHAKEAIHAGASATLMFTGTAIGLIAPRGPAYGSARIYVDGLLVKTVSLAATTTKARGLVWIRSFGTSAAHALRIVVVGTSGHPAVDLDGFAVLR